MNKGIPERCVDPVFKYCYACEYGCITYEDCETSRDIDGANFTTECILGYDTGRPEDEPTQEELKEVEQFLNGTIL